ncbi:MAG: LysM peptidoglycan-binding domain-containing protein [Candidatus Limnocylindrales bacterium]
MALTKRVTDSTPRAPARMAPDGDALDPICPYLLADEGGWRAARPMPEHRCMGQRPPASIELVRQRRLCLTATHVECPIYLAATQDRRAAMAAAGLRAERVAARRHVALTRPTPTALERPSAVPGPVAFLGGTRRAAEAALIAVMVLAAVILFAARFGGFGLVGAGPAAPSNGSVAGAAATSIGSPRATPRPTQTIPPGPTPTPTAVPTLSPPPSPTTSAAPSAAATRTYRVQSGDTLSGIAARFGTTVSALEHLNNITDPRSLRAGQVLTIP